MNKRKLGKMGSREKGLRKIKLEKIILKNV